jgi:hypothetical protein
MQEAAVIFRADEKAGQRRALRAIVDLVQYFTADSGVRDVYRALVEHLDRQLRAPNAHRVAEWGVKARLAAALDGLMQLQIEEPLAAQQIVRSVSKLKLRMKPSRPDRPLDAAIIELRKTYLAGKAIRPAIILFDGKRAEYMRVAASAASTLEEKRSFVIADLLVGIEDVRADIRSQGVK